MRARLLSLVLMLLSIPVMRASAQAPLGLSTLTIQLWPEYDQRSMLVITDFTVPAGSGSPSELNFRIPADANLIAVAAYADDGSLVNTEYDGPQEEGGWQSFSIPVGPGEYRFEYYQPLTIDGTRRSFTYDWDGRYSVETFGIRVLEPLDTTSLVTDPRLPTRTQENGLTYHVGEARPLAEGERFTLILEYEKTSDALIAPPQGIQPSVTVDENTPGRVSMENAMPYVLGTAGILLVLGGGVYYWQAGRRIARKPRRRGQARDDGDPSATGAYCPQCGARAKPGDRFCRVCGTRLRQAAE